MLKNLKFRIKRNFEIFLLVFLILTTAISTSLYNSKKKLNDETYVDFVDNLYLKKTLKYIIANLEPKYKKIKHQIKSGETFDKILNVARAFSNTVEIDSAIMKIWLDWSTTFGNATWTLYEDLQSRVADLFCEIIGVGQTSRELSPDLDPEIAAYIIIGGGQMAAQMKLTSPAAIDIEMFLHQLVAGALQTNEISTDEILV